MILFLASSGTFTGIGHIRRSAQLATELKNRNHEVLFCLKHEFGSIESFKNYQLNCFIISRTDQIQEVLKLYPQINLIVSDLHDLQREDTEKITSGHSKVKILALDYFDMEDNHVHTIVNLYNHNVQHARPVSEKVKYLEGPSYGVLRPEFKALVQKRKSKSKRSVKRLLVSFGGSDPRQHSLSIIAVLGKAVHNKIYSVTIVIGPDFIHKAKVLDSVAKSKLPISTMENPTNIARLMYKADLCISGSGTTILELAALGTPAIVIPQSPAEANFAAVFEKAGFARIAGSPEAIDIGKFQEALVYFDNPQTLERASALGRELCDGKGEERIIHEINLLLNS